MPPVLIFEFVTLYFACFSFPSLHSPRAVIFFCSFAHIRSPRSSTTSLVFLFNSRFRNRNIIHCADDETREREGEHENDRRTFFHCFAADLDLSFFSISILSSILRKHTRKTTFVGFDHLIYWSNRVWIWTFFLSPSSLTHTRKLFVVELTLRYEGKKTNLLVFRWNIIKLCSHRQIRFAALFALYFLSIHLRAIQFVHLLGQISDNQVFLFSWFYAINTSNNFWNPSCIHWTCWLFCCWAIFSLVGPFFFYFLSLFFFSSKLFSSLIILWQNYI